MMKLPQTIKGVSRMKSLSQVSGGKQQLFEGFHEIQRFFEEHLTGEHWTFMNMLRLIEDVMPTVYHPKARTGRPPYDDMAFFRAFLALNYFAIPSVVMLIKTLKSEPNLRQLCGFKKVPANSSFSRHLDMFSRENILNVILDAMVKKAYKNLPIIHVCRDSTAITARETIPKKAEKKDKKPLKRRGRPPKGSPKVEKEPPQLKKQLSLDAHTILEGLNKDCSWGCKKNSQGNVFYWKGYKLHLDVSDIGFPLSAWVSGANVHDSQLAIPLEKLTSKKVKYFYSVMDSAYDAKWIHAYIRRCQRIPVIDPNMRRNKNYILLDPAKQERYKIRTAVERAYSHLKDRLIPQSLFVKGNPKVSFVLMMGVISLAALKYFQYFSTASG
jgi:hypothetical protein